jgi:exosortase/archaeosortase family protein
MALSANKSFARFVIIFTGVFSFCYLSSVAVIGLSSPGNYYSAFIDHNLNFIGWMRASLLFGTKMLLKILGTETYYVDEYVIRKVNGRGIKLVYGCIGYGVMSFWIAFITAYSNTLVKKFKWLFGGLLLIWLINITRMALLLLATNNNWKMPLGWDHHTWFNIFAYTAIFVMMYFFDKGSKDNKHLPFTVE